MKRLICLTLLAGSALFAANAHAASDDDFTSCDGYEAPKGKADGISKATWLWGLASRTADIRRENTPSLGADGLAACERALADARLKTEFLVRRANLLQNRALHALGAGQPELALALVDESDKIGTASEGQYFARSIGVGNLAIRAYAFVALGRREDARRAIDAMVATRRWSQSVQHLALALETHMDSSVDGHIARLRSAIPLNPKKAHNLFWAQFLEGNYTEALKLYPALDFTQPNMRGGWSLDDEDILDAKLLEDRSSAIGAAAYAQAVLKQERDARATIADGLRMAEAALVPPPPRANGKPPKRTTIELYQRRKPFATRAKQTLEQWQKAIEFRLNMANQSVQAIETQFIASKLNELPILPDILGHIATVDPKLKPETDRIIEGYRQEIDRERLKASKLDPESLVILLPRPETPGAVPVLKPAGDGYFLSDSGLSREKEGESDVWTIRYTHAVAPMAADEELAMLGAAQTAQKLGFDSFLILNTSSIARTTTVHQTYGAGYTLNSGYEAQLRVRFVDAATPTNDVGWRLISAQKVIQELEARYKSGGITIAF